MKVMLHQSSPAPILPTTVMCAHTQSALSWEVQSVSHSNLYLLLLIVFALAGLLLIIFLITLNLTVSEGTINGIIFYANIVHINRSIFFPSTEANPLAIFIAWLNLDLGIETCFYNGMDAYAKAWLQFVFPVYIWLIGLPFLGPQLFSPWHLSPPLPPYIQPPSPAGQIVGIQDALV